MPKTIHFHETGSAQYLKVEEIPLAEPGENKARLKAESTNDNGFASSASLHATNESVDMTEVKPLFKLVQDGDAIVVQVLQRTITDQLEVDEFGSKIKRIAKEFPARLVVLNCARLEFLSSSALGAIIESSLALKEMKGELRIARLSDYLKSVFKITKLDTVIQIMDDYKAAIVV